MAPEVWAEETNYTRKVDVFSATLVVWYMLTGELPFLLIPTKVSLSLPL
jgi:serine/threonine protein kinase